MIELKKSNEERRINKFNPGVPALIVGVIFVVYAGLIFATTAWAVLPDFGKIVLIVAFAGIFFVASGIAEHLLHIRQTGKAFYVLGSIFLFLTSLAIGFFELLGSHFTLSGQGLWWVLLVGTLMSEGALVLGKKKFQGGLYDCVCYFGISIGVVFLLQGLTTTPDVFINSMMFYAVAALAAGWWWQKPVLRKFALVQFILLSAGLVLCVLFEMLICLIFNSYDIKVWYLGGLAAMAIGAAVLARSYKQTVFCIWHNISWVILFQYAAFHCFSEVYFQYAIPAILCMVLFLAGRYFKYPFRSWGSDLALTIWGGFKMLVLVIGQVEFYHGVPELLIVLATVLLFAVVWNEWSKGKRNLRHAMPLILWFLTYAGRLICLEIFAVDLPGEAICFVYLVGFILWDLWKRDQLTGGILLVGGIAQMQVFLLGAGNYPFCLLLAGYLFLKERNRYLEVKSLYLLAGVYFLVTRYTPNAVVDLWILLGVLGLEFVILVMKLGQEREKTNKFWSIVGNVLVIFMMLCFYLNESLGMEYLVGCLAVFGIVYTWSYRGGFVLGHLPCAITVCVVPALLYGRYDIGGNQLYLLVAVAVLASGILFRFRWPIIEGTEKIDWYHIVVGIVVVIMAAVGDGDWGFYYTLLLVLYVLQYAAIKSIRKEIWSVAFLIMILAFWQQPFVTVPNQFWLEFHLFPIAAGTAVLPVIWGRNKYLCYLQRTIYLGCLLVLAGRTIMTESLWDVMILEGISLLIFVWAQKVKDRWWIVVSGVLLVAEVVYKTSGFWLSIPWWIYLLVAGIGLMVFAAWHEMKKD